MSVSLWQVGDTKLQCDDDEVLYDGVTVEDMCLTHVLPGYEDIELCRGGRDKVVTLDNLESYINVRATFFPISKTDRRRIGEKLRKYSEKNAFIFLVLKYT